MNILGFSFRINGTGISSEEESGNCEVDQGRIGCVNERPLAWVHSSPAIDGISNRTMAAITQAIAQYEAHTSGACWCAIDSDHE